VTDIWTNNSVNSLLIKYSLSSCQSSSVNEPIIHSVEPDICISLIRRGAVHGLRINRKKRNHLSDILYSSLKVGQPAAPLETNPDKERSLFLDYSIQHLNAENAVTSVLRSVILLPSYQPGISCEWSSRKLVEHNGSKSYPWLTIQDIHAISNNIARERIRFYEESDTVIDDWRRLLPTEWATEQAEQNINGNWVYAVSMNAHSSTSCHT
jgi:hypothetical protein